MYRKKLWPQIMLIGLLLFLSVAILNNSFASNEEIYLKLDKGLFYLKQVYETISRNYVDEVDPEGLSKSAIQGIVQELDPYTVFFEKKGSEQLEIITKGKYGGLGMEIGKREGKITIISPIDDTPAQRAGIRAGDIIITIDGIQTDQLTLDQASGKLRGQAGTQVELEIQRPGLTESIKLTLTRQDIIIKDVPYADFIEPGIAFIRLSSFSDKAGSEVREAVRNLQKKGQIDKMVLDLRGNPGGLLASAVEVANIFLPKGEMVVQTRGIHERETQFATTENSLLPNIPLVALVDGGSASASEIVSGAIQDLDRGIVVGSKTFGKGLVQQVYPVDKVNDAFLKMTTAKYYIPSGRCIQKDDYKKNKDVFTDLSDSVDYDNHKKYFTRNGRVVFGGGGIQPDIEVERESTDQFLIALWSQGHFFRFTVDYLANHPALQLTDGFTVNEEIMDEFRKYLQQKDMDFDIEGEPELEEFLKIAADEKYHADLVDLVTVALQKLEKEKSQEFDKNLDRIKQTLESEFAEKLGGTSARIATLLKHDETVSKALEIIKSQEQYLSVLAVKK
jgi:carboxyl-terminal processing protease